MVYEGCSYMTARKRYAQYLELSGKNETQELTVLDISVVDKVPIKSVIDKLRF